MKRKIVRELVLIGFLTVIVFCSCKKFIDVPLPPTQTATGEVFASEQTAASAVGGLYSQLSSSNLSFSNGGMSVYPSLSGDELYNTAPNEDLDAFRTNSIPATNSTGIYQRIWLRAYTIIYQCNAVLNGLENARGLNRTVQGQLRGETLTIRAFCYFYLVNLYGDVPLITGTDYRENAIMPRTEATAVKAQIRKDLEEALTLLPTTYTGTGRGRINKWASAALLARVYLYTQEWALAEQMATEVINSGLYSLVSNLNNVFVAGSNEAIWQLYRETNNTAEGAAFIPSSSSTKPTYAATDVLLNAFEANDQRKTSWLKANVINGQNYYYPYKYKVRTGTPVTEYLVALRLAEQYLIRAEARAEQNKIEEAKSDVNTVRKRAGLANTTAQTKTEVLAAIERERQTELFAEWGHRWFDLKRRGRADAVLGALKAPNWQSTDVLYPIPLQEIQRNVALVQNEGY